ncbi:Fis family transcriptional regulator (plasmid) [Rahnella aceris]|uniref:helix-turn-helix domain-containing protein n=1 Tax=Rahnella sp. (strain Y9602) TaxID=2703885 RepID=UPI00190613B9|nr:helix-turn-helix domain-containing protein [Rahnella aceris]QQN37677.1 Fis family transcriptional regulator [Rahnella aceris]
MRHRLKSLLALLESDSVEQLIHRFLTVHHHRQRYNSLVIAKFNAGEGRLDCSCMPALNQNVELKMDVDIEDTNHPLVQVLRNGTPGIWDSLHQGVRIENKDFRRFVQELPVSCGLYALPLFDVHGQVCGVIAVFAVGIGRFADPLGMFGIYCQVFQHRFNKLQEMDTLRTQLRQIRTVFKQREKQMDDLLATMSNADAHTLPGMAQDYSKIDDLNEAVEKFECAVITQRLRLLDCDKQRIAKSLRIAPRTLSYKMSKYGCQP